MSDKTVRFVGWLLQVQPADLRRCFDQRPEATALYGNPAILHHLGQVRSAHTYCRVQSHTHFSSHLFPLVPAEENNMNVLLCNLFFFLHIWRQRCCCLRSNSNGGSGVLTPLALVKMPLQLRQFSLTHTKLLVTSSARRRCRRNTAEHVNILLPLGNHFHSLTNLELFANVAVQRVCAVGTLRDMQGRSISA